MKKKPQGFHKNMPHFHSVSVSAVIFKDNSNVTLISMFVVELPKLQTWQYDKKKNDHVEISQPSIVFVYSSYIQNVDLLNRNTERFLTKMRSKNGNLEFSISYLTQL
jgi:hypothetical protein